MQNILNNFISERFYNVFLRVATLSTRFLFIFFLAKYLDPSSFGYYGLFSAAIGYALFFVGLDFYTYVSREILKSPVEHRGQMLKGQAVLSGILYVIFFPVTVIFLAYADWPGLLPWWFFPLLILEHFNQEIFRLMIALSEQITASVILFVRQGSWAMASVLLLSFHPPSRNLDTVLALWAVAGFAAAAMGIWKINKLDLGGWRYSVDWQWIKNGIAVSGAFLIATLALRGVNTFDRYWLEALGGIDVVAAYILLIGVAGTLMTFLDAGVFAYAYPKLIEYHHLHEKAEARALVQRVLLQTVVFSVAFALVSWLLLPYLLRWIDNPVYNQSSNLYPWLLFATVLNALGMAPHYGLYAQGKDKPIIYSHGASLVFFIASTWLLSDRFGPMAVPMGLNLAFALILVWKSLAYWQTCKGPLGLNTTTQSV